MRSDGRLTLPGLRPRLSPLVTARRGKNLIQRCLSDDPHNSTGKEYPEPRMRQYMAPKGVVAQPMPTPSTRQPRRRAVSQPRRLPPPQPMTSVAESQRQELQENYAPYPSAHAAINMPPPSVESSSQREVKRRKTTENLRTGHDVESTAALPPMPVMPPPRPIPLAIPRSHRAERMLAEYCRFAGQRYQHHFDSEVPIIEGTFFVQFVSESFIIFDELQFSESNIRLTSRLLQAGCF